MSWDRGGSLGLVYGEDSFRKLTPKELAEEKQNAQSIEKPKKNTMATGTSMVIISHKYLTGKVAGNKERSASRENHITSITTKAINAARMAC